MLQIYILAALIHPLLKGEYTGHEKTYFGDLNISPRLAETKQNQQFLEKSDLPFFMGGSRFWLGKMDPKMVSGGSQQHTPDQKNGDISQTKRATGDPQVSKLPDF